MKKFILRTVVTLICCFLIVLAFALWPTSTPPLNADQHALDNPELVQKGRYLATLGDCAACHTQSGSALYAGGAAIQSPIGGIYPPNITPDKENGIGEYTLDDFARAMRNGIRKDGITLYPAMPYPSYSRLSDDDITALYAYFRYGVEANATPNKPTDIIWPLSTRWPLAIWRKLFAPEAVAFDAARYHDAKIAQGAYIVEGLGHCGTCHTPRDFTLKEQGLDNSSPTYLAGGQVIDGWFVPSLLNNAEGLKHYSAEDIVATLRTGRTAKHVVIGSPMNDVVINSSSMWNVDDLEAVAAYLKSLPESKSEATAPVAAVSQESDQALNEKARMAFAYQKSCSYCHESNGQGEADIFPALAGNNTVLAPNPQSVIRIILDGYDVPTIDSKQIPMRMPHFRDRLSDKEIADIVNYIRGSWGNQASTVTPEQVKQIRLEHK
ncbi:cytochrome c [Pragia fontium]|uniref:Cytochrome c n=1 Tax=Pragia fontium TaxID=82985 RepID=A0ABQ5LKA0_9GAMM|nr:cytochrome c [Pragia fontium]GKX64037.1 cytochrome c [Pragia fontium]